DAPAPARRPAVKGAFRRVPPARPARSEARAHCAPRARSGEGAALRVVPDPGAPLAARRARVLTAPRARPTIRRLRPPAFPAMTIRLSQAFIAVLLVLCCGCTGLGRKVNQSLPEFMRGDPGKEEKERISHLQQRLAAPPGASAPRTAAF